MNVKVIVSGVGLVWLLALTGPAQGFGEGGWINASGWLEPSTSTNLPESQFMEGMSALGAGGPSIAEAVTPEIEALARGLGNDPGRIFNYVHGQIRHVLYFGSKKGAQLTLLEGSGNDFDQCALLVALLRAAGHEAEYEFGVLEMPIDAPDQFDVRHWLGLSLINTNWSATQSYFSYVLGARGYPYLAFPGGGTNKIAFHRVWVKLTVGSTNFYLDPAFKITEPVAGIDLVAATGLSSNTLMSVAGGTATNDYAQNLNELAVRNKLRDYTTNLLAHLQTNYPNAMALEILGGRRRAASAGGLPLSEARAFPLYTPGGQLALQTWENQPTNLMAKMSLSLAGTNRQWCIPELQGRRLTLTFSPSGLAQFWLEDELQVEVATGGGQYIAVSLDVNHPHGNWNLANNTLADNTGFNDQTFTSAYWQRTNATYVLTYGFETGPDWLRQRQARLDAYRQQGFADSSREVVAETLNVMGLTWLVQTERVRQWIATHQDMLPQTHHAFGRVAQEKGRGYKIDVPVLTGVTPASGVWTEDVQRLYRAVDVMAYFASGLEHGMIEQLQSSGLAAASTIKMLQVGNTNGQKTFLLHSNNWSTISGQLANYDLNWLYWHVTNGFTLLLPANGANYVAGVGSWIGSGIVAVGFPQGGRASSMLISGGYLGGYVSDEDATVDPATVSLFGSLQPGYFDLNSHLWDAYGADPVSLTDGSFAMSKTDLALGQPEPRGISLTRHYSSARRHHNAAGMAHGWIHNYHCTLAEVSAPLLGLGQGTPPQMAAMLVATRAAVELYDAEPAAKNWLLTALIAKWGVDQLLNNSVAVSLGKDTLQFIKQPDGSFTAPPGLTMTLRKTNTVYWLQERHGNTFKFNAAGRLTNLVDQYNQNLSITYNASNWVATVKDWKNRQLTFHYSGNPLRLTSVTDSTSPTRTVAYGYTTSGGRTDLTSVTDPENQTSTFVYDTNHQIIATRNALNQTVTSNRYDGFGRVIEQYSQGDTNQTWRFYWAGSENTEEDPAGGRRTFYYDDQHRLTGQRDALGHLSQTFYDGQDHIVMTVSPLNETNRFEYDGRHNLVRSVDPLGFTNQFFYDAQDRLIRTVDARGHTNTFGYNAQHRLIGQTNGAGDWVTFSYNTDGTLAGRTDPGGTTSHGYDSYGQLNRITYPASLGSEGFLNSARGDVLSRTNARGFVTSFQYNYRRELTNTIAPTNVTTKIACDAVGNVLSTTDARGFTTSNTWSATRKLQATTRPATPQGVPVTTNLYDSRDWLARTLDPLQQATLYTNDAAQRLLSTTDPLQRTTRFGYDAVGRRTARTNAALEVSREFWNARGELVRSTDGANRAVGRAYDAAGSLIRLTNRNGKVWQFRYDGANRLTNTLTPLGRETWQVWNNRGLLAAVREPSGQWTTNLYDPKGRLTNVTDAVGVRLYTYDANDNVTSITNAGQASRLSWAYDAYDRATAFTNADGYVIQYRYDANGNLTNLIYPGNRPVFYAYDSLNRLTNVTDWANRQTSFEYDLASRLRQITRPNGTVREIACDAAGQTTNIWEKTVSGTPIALFKLNWNAAARVEWEFAAPLPHSYTPPQRAMTYDDDNRVLTVNGQSVTHDDDGNLTTGPLPSGGWASFSYDARNRLLAGGDVQYGYDPAGNRIALTNGAEVTRFVVNPNAPLSQVLMRVRPGVTNYYVYGLGLLYEITETATRTNALTYHYDYRGSTVALTDHAARVTDRIEYSAYGLTTYRSGTNDTPFLFNGRYGVQTDPNGLLYMRARYYNPYLCRFVSADPIGFEGGLNYYAYADGNPVSLIDPLGLQGIPSPANVAMGFAPGYGQDVSDWNSRFQIANQHALAVEGCVGAGAAIGVAGGTAIGLGAVGLVAVGVPQPVVTGGLLVVGASGVVAGGYSIYNDPSPYNIAFNAGGLAGGVLAARVSANYVASALSPSSYQPSSSISLASDVSMAWRDTGGHINPLAFLSDWMLPGARIGPMSTGPSIYGAAGTVGGTGFGTAGGVSLLFGSPVDWLGNPLPASGK
ncbi:MAG: RHS repeat-associated core domain-containing protein [Limisphaerales bacterium]